MPEEIEVNKIRSKQRGMAVTSWIIVIAVALFFALLGIKMIPTYMEFYSISKILESVAEDRSLKNASTRKSTLHSGTTPIWSCCCLIWTISRP